MERSHPDEGDDFARPAPRRAGRTRRTLRQVARTAGCGLGAILVAAIFLGFDAMHPEAAHASTPAPSGWYFETLDGNCAPLQECADRGATDAAVAAGSAATEWNGQPHVWFHDVDNGDLRHGWWTGSSWRFTTLDGHCRSADCAAAGAVDSAIGGRIAVTVWNGDPHVFYADLQRGDLRHAWWSVDRWYFETLDGNCADEACSRRGAVDRNVGTWAATVVWSAQPHVFYRDETNGDLRQGWWTGTAWQFRTLDGHCAGACGDLVGPSTAAVGMWNTAVDWDGQLHVFGYDSTNGDLRHAWWSVDRWYFETLDGNCRVIECAGRGARSANVGRSASVTVWNGTPHVSYYDMTGGDLRHGWWTGSHWFFETLDGNCTGGECSGRGAISANVGFHGEITVWNGLPHVWYYDNSDDDLRHGWWTGTNWRFETLDGNCPDGDTCAATGATGSFVGLDPTFLDWGGQPHVWYRDWLDGDLRHAWYP